MERIIFKDLGRIDYRQAWDYQTEVHRGLVQRKLHNQQLELGHPDWQERLHYLLFCEHPHVYTLGKSGKPEHLLLNEAELAERDAVFYKINRGGDITYHGPGQLVAYPIFDLDGFFTDVHRYVRTLEEVVIQVLAGFDIQGKRLEGYTGVWLDAAGERPLRKICAIGVHLSRWVTMHGFALNVNTNLDYFSNIIPCGIQDTDKAVTSIAAELGQEVDRATVMTLARQQFADLFEFEYFQAPAQ